MPCDGSVVIDPGVGLGMARQALQVLVTLLVLVPGNGKPLTNQVAFAAAKASSARIQAARLNW